MTSKLTREWLQHQISAIEAVGITDSNTLAAFKLALAAMDSEPHTDDELSNLLWYSQEATCHSDPNYFCEFQRLATPGFIVSIIRELQERRKAEQDSEPVFTLEVSQADYKGQKLGNHFGFITLDAARELKEGNYQLYTAQPAPVVPDRSIFEKWWESQNGAPLDGWDSLRTTDGYCDDGIDGQFEAWNAAMLSGGKS
ncbi:TPA: hypothetical protein L7592_003241 [Klebsiella pneumoniae subsp. pneumoniae]|nr:hypothetical protein [Klebsiella pneumoniae subsp. pneumoniae]